MSSSIHRLPFDILFNLVQYLSLEDAVHLGWASKQLNSILTEGTLCRAVIRANANYSAEAKLARAGKITFQQALQRTSRRRAAFSRLDPFLVRVAGRGSSFIYGDGVLCTVGHDSIRVESLHHPGSLRRTINLRALHQRCARLGHNDQYNVELLNYAHGILALCLHPENGADGHLLAAIDVGRCSRIACVTPLDSINHLFVRNDSKFLYYGTHSRLGSDDFNEWIIRGVSLNSSTPLPYDNQVQLENFVGSDVGVNVAFKVHDGYFYALSNQPPTLEEVDWTSFYTIVRFPLDSPSQSTIQKNSEIYRRQHQEGPIHDSWTTLDLQLDERTNALVIVEARREWPGGGTESSRTFYTQPVWFAEEVEDLSIPESPGEGSSTATSIALPQDDLFSTVVTSENNPRYAPRQERPLAQVHPEYGHPDDPAPSFIIARTKLRAYNLSSSAFLDLVQDSSCCAHGCLRLRLGSRYSGVSSPVTAPDTPKSSSARSSRQECGSRIAMWPGPLDDAASQDDVVVHDIINQHRLASWSNDADGAWQVTAASDERSVVFLVKPARVRSEADRIGNLVLIAFDSFMLFESDLQWSRRPAGWPGE